MKRRIPARADVGAVVLFWGILVCEQSAAALFGGAEEGQAPLLLSSSILNSLRAGDQGGVYSEASFCVSVYCAGKQRGSRCLKGLLKGFHSVVLFTYVRAC